MFETFSIRVNQFHQVIKMRDDNHYQQQIPTLSLISLSYHIQCSSNLYNKGQFHQAIKMRGDNPTLTTNPNTSLHIFVISYPTFFKSSQQGIFDTTYPPSTEQGIFLFNWTLQYGNLLHGSVGRGICDDILLAPGGAYSLGILVFHVNHTFILCNVAVQVPE